MAFKKRNLSVKEAMQEGFKKKFALVHMISEVFLGSCKNLKILNEEEILEARYFDESSEIRIFRDDNQLRALEIYDTTDEDTEIFRYEIDSNFKSAGKILLVKEYYAEDEDGQSFVKLKRLYGIEG